MRRTRRNAALVGAVALAAAVLLVPAGAQADPSGGPLKALSSALAGLVQDDTLTQEQADAVVARVQQERGRGAEDEAGRGHGRDKADRPQPNGHGLGQADRPQPNGHGLGRGLGRSARLTAQEMADAAGATAEELRAAFRAGTPLAELAESNGISRATLVDRLVTAVSDRLDALVADGRMTRAQADARTEGLTERVEEMVDRAGKGPRHMGQGPDGD